MHLSMALKDIKFVVNKKNRKSTRFNPKVRLHTDKREAQAPCFVYLAHLDAPNRRP